MARATALLLLLLLMATLAPGVGAGPSDADEPEVEPTFNDLYPAAFRVRVNQAIDRGAGWLLRTQHSDGSWSGFSHHGRYPMGSTALATLTLLKCGIPKEHPAIVSAFGALRKLPMRLTYSVSVLLMALDAKYAPTRDPFAVDEVDRYGNRRGKDPCANAITPEDRAWMRQGVAFLLENQQSDGVWRYPAGGYDLSNTQFALLGLHAATRCGVTVDPGIWLTALRHTLAQQEKTGEPVMYKANEVRGRYRFEWTERAVARGFRYAPNSDSPTGSMTTAGLTSLIVCQSRLWRRRAFTGAQRADTRRAVRDAVAWLQTHFSVEHNPLGGYHWLYYYLYGLERAGILGRFRFLGTHDWYLEGAEFLLAQQGHGGDWPDTPRTEDSCFAILFLKRATTRMDAPVITPGGSRSAGATPPPAPASGSPRSEAVGPLIAVARAIRELDSDDPDVVFLATLNLGHLGHARAVDPLVRILKRHADADVRLGAANALGRLRAADAVPALVHALTDKDDLVAFAAEAALVLVTAHRVPQRLTGTDTRNDRVRVQKAWQAWWREGEATVRGRRDAAATR